MVFWSTLSCRSSSSLLSSMICVWTCLLLVFIPQVFKFTEHVRIACVCIWEVCLLLTESSVSIHLRNPLLEATRFCSVKSCYKGEFTMPSVFRITTEPANHKTTPKPQWTTPVFYSRYQVFHLLCSHLLLPNMLNGEHAQAVLFRSHVNTSHNACWSL